MITHKRNGKRQQEEIIIGREVRNPEEGLLAEDHIVARKAVERDDDEKLTRIVKDSDNGNKRVETYFL